MNLPHSPIAAHPAAHRRRLMPRPLNMPRLSVPRPHMPLRLAPLPLGGSEAQRQPRHAAGAPGREGAMSRTAPRGGNAARRRRNS